MNKEDKLKRDYEFARKCALENIKLMEMYKKRIDKATEYINGWLSFSHINCNEIKECQNILKILKGELE